MGAAKQLNMDKSFKKNIRGGAISTPPITSVPETEDPREGVKSTTPGPLSSTDPARMLQIDDSNKIDRRHTVQFPAEKPGDKQKKRKPRALRRRSQALGLISKIDKEYKERVYREWIQRRNALDLGRPKKKNGLKSKKDKSVGNVQTPETVSRSPPPMPTINVTDEAYTDCASRQSICFDAEDNAILYGRPDATGATIKRLGQRQYDLMELKSNPWSLKKESMDLANAKSEHSEKY